jgi:hypothetical protein
VAWLISFSHSRPVYLEENRGFVSKRLYSLARHVIEITAAYT